MNTLTSPTGAIFEVGSEIGATEIFSIHKGRLEDGTQCMIKIAKTPEDNGFLDREAFVLNTLRDGAESTQKAFEVETKKTSKLNYQLCFPAIIASFESDELAGCRVNVTSVFASANQIQDLVPLYNIPNRLKLKSRIDPKTSVWILGKLLKLLVFTHSQNISIGNFTLSNVLINPKRHIVAIYDWSEAGIHTDSIPDHLVHEEISKATQFVMQVLGANLETGALPDHEDLTDGRYEEFLVNLLREHERTALEAHGQFYELICELWPRAFHPYTLIPLP